MAQDDADVSRERSLRNADWIPHHELRQPDERSTRFLQRAQLRQFVRQELLVGDLQDSHQEIASQRREALLGRPPKKDVTRKQREMGYEIPAGPALPVLDLRDVKWNLERTKIASKRLLLATSHVRDPPGVLSHTELQNIGREDFGLDLQQRHGFRRSLVSEASAPDQTVEITNIFGK